MRSQLETMAVCQGSGGEANAAALLAIHLRKGTIRIESKRD
jgi:hypothetical protein